MSLCLQRSYYCWCVMMFILKSKQTFSVHIQYKFDNYYTDIFIYCEKNIDLIVHNYYYANVTLKIDIWIWERKLCSIDGCSGRPTNCLLSGFPLSTKLGNIFLILHFNAALKDIATILGLLIPFYAPVWCTSYSSEYPILTFSSNLRL